MNLPALAIKNHQFTLVFMLLLVGAGVTAIFSMPRSEDPQISVPGNTVIAVYPGASPVELEQLIVDPIEDALNELDDIKRIAASIEAGLATIEIEFVTGSDGDEKHKLVVERVNYVRSDLPEGVAMLKVAKWSITEVAIMQLAMTAAPDENFEYAVLEQWAEELEGRIERLDGIKGAEIWACPEQQVQVVMDLERMAQHHVPMSQLFGAIKSANASIPGGSVDIGPKRLNVKTTGSYTDMEEIADTVVASHAGNPVRVRDVAKVKHGYEAADHIARFNGDTAVFVTVKQKANTNIMTVRKAIDRELAAFAKELPDGMGLAVVFDQSQSVTHRLSNFTINLLMGVTLVALVMFLTLGWRPSLIVALVIPTSVAVSLGWVDAAGFGIQQMTISGLVIALGLLVDNGIVVVESITRYLRRGCDRMSAAMDGTREVAWPIISSTATTVLAFLPMAFLASMTGDFIRSMPITVITTLTASLLLALTFTPLVASRLLTRTATSTGGLAQPLTDRIASGPYPRLLDAALRNRKVTLFFAGAALVGSFLLAGDVGVSFFPKAEKPQLIVNIDLPQGSNLSATDAVVRDVEALLAEREEVVSVATNVGRGNPRVYYNVVPQHETPTHAQLLVKLRRFELGLMRDMIASLRRELDDYPGADIEVKELQQGPPVEAPIAIKVLGTRLEDLSVAAKRTEELIAAVPGVVNVNNPLRTAATDLRVVVHRDKAARLGFSLAEVDMAVRAALAGWRISALREDSGEELDIIARATETTEPTYSALEQVVLMAKNGARIPLGQVATIEFERGPARIFHFELDRAATVTADVREGYNVAAVTASVMQSLDGETWPRGVDFHIGGEQEERVKSFAGMRRALLVAFLGILAVLVLQFRSFAQPLIVFAAVPLAAVGSIGALWITGNNFSFTAFIGFTSLVGIVVNNSIILLDYANSRQREGASVRVAIRDAGKTRLLPILLTTATTIGGLLPLTLRGGTLWAPLGWTIIGGLVVSTLLTLIVVPVLYSYLGRAEAQEAGGRSRLAQPSLEDAAS
jgi:multidrug efflux pump subunit AcrB